MSRLIRPAVLLALIGVLAAVLVACGGSSDDPNKLLKETFSGDHKVTSGKLNLAVDVSAQGVQNLSQPVKIALTGPFQSQGKNQLPNFDLNLTFSGGGQSFSAGAVSTGGKGYLKFQGQAYEVPATVLNQFKQGFAQAQQRNQGKNTNALKQLGLNPLDWLKDPKVEGDEDVGGTSTKHISANIDVGKFVADLSTLLKNAQSLGGAQTGQLPSNLTAQQQQQIQQAVKSAKVQVWTGADDKTLRKLQVEPEHRRHRRALGHADLHARDRRPQPGPDHQRPGQRQAVLRPAAAAGRARARWRAGRRGRRRRRDRHADRAVDGVVLVGLRLERQQLERGPAEGAEVRAVPAGGQRRRGQGAECAQLLK